MSTKKEKQEQEPVVRLTREQLDAEVERLQGEIDALTAEGETRILELKNEIRSIRSNKQIAKETKDEIIARDRELIEKAQEVRKTLKGDLKEKRAEMRQLLRDQYKILLAEKAESNFKANSEAKEKRNGLLYQEELRHKEAMASLQAEKGDLATPEQKQAYQDRLITEKKTHAIAVEDAKNEYRLSVDRNKDKKHAIYLEWMARLRRSNGDSLPFREKTEAKWENYRYRFNARDFIFNNGLYLIIILFLVVVTIYAAVETGQFIFTPTRLSLILNQASPRLFFSLGVAGLIVLAGTDLSIGRMIGLSGVLTGMLVTTSGIPSDVKFFGQSMDFSMLPLGFRVVLAFLISIVVCGAFSAMAGFFTARFKMHPFISTLANQLIIFGGGVLVFTNGYTGMPDQDVADGLVGDIQIGSFGFPKMIIYAIILIIVMWFIWNKTKFGKNMFAVGGNPEAAAVSGINVFRTTVGVFLMAGILYGIGGSLFGIYSGSVKMINGQGMESDAIAACVVGGVSFSGGVGTIRGVVIGTLLFQFIAFILPYIGIGDANAQLLIKGIVILVAVTFDCVKFLKKR